MRKQILTLFVLLIVMTGCGMPVEQKKEQGKLTIVVSFYPLMEFTKAIAGDTAIITSLVPNGVEPHEWEPTPNDIKAMLNADLLIYNGAGMEGWIQNVLKVIDRTRTKVIEASSGIQIMSTDDTETSGKDPHVWLDPLLAQKEVNTIRDALTAADSSSAEFYRFNAEQYNKKLAALDAKFKSELSHCDKKVFVTSHAAFGYLAGEYGLTQEPIAGMSPEIEPTPKHVAELVDFVRQKNIKLIFVETMVNPKIAEALANDAGASTDVLNPLEGLSREEQARGENYFGIMEQNLNKLKNALVCSS